jgi:hypothetical protein
MGQSPADERKALERMKREAKVLLRKKPDPSTPAPRADRFSAPIGLDDAGKPFGAHELKKAAPKRRG